MKEHRDVLPEKGQSGATATRPRKRRAVWRIVGLVFLILAILLGIGRLMLPGFARDYVNKTLDRNSNYSGTIGKIGIHLWRGAYSIHDIRISKTTGDVPIPFFAARRVDFAIQWNALIHRRVVGRVLLYEPEMNFVDGGSESDSQTGAGGPWLAIIQDLFPFTINQAIVRNGSVRFLASKKKTPVDVHLTQVEAVLDNLGNIQDEANPLAATVRATAVAMDQAKMDLAMKIDPTSYHPTFHMALRLLGLDVTKLNDLALAYGKFDFKRGWFDLVVEADAKEGQLTGYVKPLFRDLKVFSVTEDLKDKNILEYFWQALVGGVTSLLKNWSRDQFGTLIPFSGDMTQTTRADILTTVGNVLRNAFIRAYLPRLEGQQQFEGMEFGPPEFTENLSVGGA